jgi:tetratricopeptide (TPR) repeat protein
VEVAPSYGLSWQVATGVLKEKMIYGWGPENFSLAFDKFGAGNLANSQLSGLRFFDATSEVFNISVHEGVVGLLAVLLLLWCLVQVVARFGGAISESVARGEGASLAVQSSGTLAATVAIVVALFMYPLNLTLWFALYALMALSALIVSGDRSRTVDIEERPMYSLSASLGFIVGLILVLSGLYFTSVRYLADVRYAHAISQKTPTEAMDGIARAVDLDSTNDRYLRDASQVALAMLREEIGKKDGGDQQAQRIQNLMASSIQLAQRAAAVQPDESLNWSNLGQVYQSMTGLVDNVEKLAEDAFRKAGELRPGDPSFENAIGQMWLARADLIRQVAQKATGNNAATLKTQNAESLTKAEEAFKKAIEKSSTYGLAIYNLGAVYDRQDKVKEAIGELEKIAPYNANQPTLMFELGLLYIRNDQKDNAVAAMQRAVLLAPQYANARWYLALLLEERDDIPGAIAQLKEIQKDNADNQVLKDKISQLEGGQREIPPAEVIETKPLE